MYMTVFKLMWPYFGRMLADKLSLYLQDRREQRLKAGEKLSEPWAELEKAVCPPCPPCPPCPTPEPAPIQPDPIASTGNKIWFGLSGVLLASAFVLMAYLFMHDDRA
jgi:hypothetical protein